MKGFSQGSAAASCGTPGSWVRDNSLRHALAKLNPKKGVRGGDGDESTELEVSLTSSHSSIKKFSEVGEERLAAYGNGEMLRER